MGCISSKRIGGDLLSHPVTQAVPSALRGLTAVFGMGTGVSPSPWPPKKINNSIPGVESACDGLENLVRLSGLDRFSRKDTKWGQAARPFSTGPLHVLPRVHARPIYLVVSKGPSGGLRPGEISS